MKGNLTDLDWERLYQRLCVLADRLKHRFRLPDVIDGCTPHDVVQDVLSEFFLSPDGLGWNGQGDLFHFLGGVVLKRRLIDHLRRQGRVAGSLDDESCSVGRRAHDRRSSKQIEDRVFIQDLFTLADQEQQALLTALAESADGGRTSNQELAKETGESERTVANLRRRLLRRVKTAVSQVISKKRKRRKRKMAGRTDNGGSS